MREEFSPAMSSALAMLRKLIREGIEFPDAVWKVTQKTGLMSHELENAYDIQCAENNLDKR